MKNNSLHRPSSSTEFLLYFSLCESIPSPFCRLFLPSWKRKDLTLHFSQSMVEVGHHSYLGFLCASPSPSSSHFYSDRAEHWAWPDSFSMRKAQKVNFISYFSPQSYQKHHMEVSQVSYHEFLISPYFMVLLCLP